MTHEQIHYYSSDRFETELGVSMCDGATEYFLRQISKVERRIYRTETALVERIVTEVGEDTLKKAYFGGDEAAIQKVRWAWC